MGVEGVRILCGCVLLGHSLVAIPVCNQRRESERPEKDRGSDVDLVASSHSLVMKSLGERVRKEEVFGKSNRKTQNLRG